MLRKFGHQPVQFILGKYPLPLIIFRKPFHLPAGVLHCEVLPDGKVEDPFQDGHFFIDACRGHVLFAGVLPAIGYLAEAFLSVFLHHTGLDIIQKNIPEKSFPFFTVSDNILVIDP